MRIAAVLYLALLLTTGFDLRAQNVEKCYFNAADSSTGYYLAIRPKSGHIKGTLLLMNSFAPPETVLPETRMHNIGYVSDLLMVYVSMGMKLYADQEAIQRIGAVAADLQSRFGIDPVKLVLGGFNNAGTIALRYTELANADTPGLVLHPRGVFAADSPTDLTDLWKWCEGQVRKNFYPGAVGDAHAFMDLMTREHGRLPEHPDAYAGLTPFAHDMDSTGNEKYLARTPVRLYFDTDIQWRLVNRRNSLYDSDIPDATEMIKRLMLLGNEEAEFVSAKQPGMRSNGLRAPGSLSIVEEVDCIHWAQRVMDIFDPVTWRAPYTMPAPKGWEKERFALPAEFSPHSRFKGVEEVRFHPDWANYGREGYWSYVYLWWINADVAVDSKILQEELRAYYDGLLRQNIGRLHIPAEKVIPTSASVRRLPDGSWSATIKWLDYLAQQPMELHGLIRLKEGLPGKQALLVEMSPQPVGNAVWRQMDLIVEGFEH